MLLIPEAETCPKIGLLAITALCNKKAHPFTDWCWRPEAIIQGLHRFVSMWVSVPIGSFHDHRSDVQLVVARFVTLFATPLYFT
jgi:hypothetical protein